MRKPEYKRCPRCELNFIKKSEKFCSVCQAELDTKGSYISDLDLELCPICKTNYIQPGEIMCDTCLKEHQNEDGELSTDWEQYINREGEEDEYVDEEEEELGGMASITDDTDDILSSGYDGDLDDFGDDTDLGEMPEEFRDDDDLENDDEEDFDDEKDSDDDDDDYDDDDDDYDDDDED